ARLEGEQALEATLAELRERLLAAEQQREEAQRGLYMAHRGVSELAGQLQGHHGRLQNARDRIARIESELAQLAEAQAAAGSLAREARSRQVEAVRRLTELDDRCMATEDERRLPDYARYDVRN